MNVIDLDCPHCNARLQIDAAYGGSVCRCDECGQLMKVPRANNHGAASARPTSPGDPEPPPAIVSTEPQKTRSAYVPIIAVAGVLMIAVVAMIIYATSGSSNLIDDDTHNASAAVHGYDTDANPFLSKKPNFFGIPVGYETTLAIDTSTISQRWFPMAKHAAIQLVLNHHNSQHVTVVFWREEDPDDKLLPLPSEPITMHRTLGLRQMMSQISRKNVLGDCQPATAINDILNFNIPPKQIIFITSQYLDDDHVRQFQELAQTMKQVRIDIITIDVELPVLKEITDRHHGQYLSLPLQRLDQWYQQAPH
jgi:hypothetical protein